MEAGSQTGGNAEERLASYRDMRDFARTPEPSGGPSGEPSGSAALQVGRRRFVVQRHRARRLHYDFRLEIDGVLVSWAVPKGPTLDPKVRRGAYHVEDHPLDYIDFEGVIPGGNYGGGDVIVWDRGTWDLSAKEGSEAGDPPDPAAALTAGELHLDLHGQKLVGRFILVRTRVGADGKEDWLLLHKRDEHAADGWDPEAHPRSVLSGRTNDEVKHNAAPADAIEELDALVTGGIWHVYGRELRVTNLDKVLFPARPGEEPVTKRELLRYAACVAPVVLPYLVGRPLNMNRFPNGAATKGFWHKALPDYAPEWLSRWAKPDAPPGEARPYLTVDEPAALVWVANYGALEWHAWTSRGEEPSQPTYALIDLDPGAATSWDDLLVLARLHRSALEHLGVKGRAKVTGRRGIQIWIPVAPGASFADTRDWTEKLSRAIGAVVPELVSWRWQVGDRSGLARLDYTQNAHFKTLVAPYSPRPAPGAPVSAPIAWEELDDPDLRSDRWTIRTIGQRLSERGDLFRPVLGEGQALPPLG